MGNRAALEAEKQRFNQTLRNEQDRQRDEQRELQQELRQKEQDLQNMQRDVQRRERELHEAQQDANKKPAIRLRDGGTYKIRNKKWGGTLFTGWGKDNHGDHHIWLEPREEYVNRGKERWTLHRCGDGNWKLRSCAEWAHGAPLFCGDDVDGHKDHWAWAHPNRDYENSGKERWEIVPQSDGSYKLYNAKWGTPLFCGDGIDHYEDHRVWCEYRRSYENNGKERWIFEEA